MGSHSVTCHPTQVSTPRLIPSHTGQYSIYLPRRDGRLSWPIVDLLVTYRDGLPSHRRSPIQVLTGPINYVDRSQRANHYTYLLTTPPPFSAQTECIPRTDCTVIIIFLETLKSQVFFTECRSSFWPSWLDIISTRRYCRPMQVDEDIFSAEPSLPWA